MKRKITTERGEGLKLAELFGLQHKWSVIR
jgi:hypothetical protein